MENCENCDKKECKYKKTRRSEREIKALQSRINRISGQLCGIKKMLDDNRYCTDILIQISAVNHAVKSLACAILEQHLNTCVVEQIKDGNTESLKEISDLMKRF